MPTDATIQDPAQPQTPTTESQTVLPDDSLFAADLTKLAPEVRSQVEPLVKTWKTQLDKWMEDQKSQVEQIQKRAQAFDYLAQRDDFRNWYQEALKREQGLAQVSTQTQSQVNPALTQEEVAAAYEDPRKWEQLVNSQVERFVQNRYAGVIDNIQKQQQELDERQKEVNMSLEMDTMFRNHQDAYDLDQAGVLEPVLYDIVDRQGKSVEQAYRTAKKIYDSVMAKANSKQAALVQDAKGSVTQGPSTSSQGQEVIYANNPDEALRMQIEARMEGRNVKVRVKQRNQGG